MNAWVPGWVTKRHADASSSGGSEAARCANSRNAGRRNMPGASGSRCDSLSMNIRHISSGAMPFARPAAMKLPELTPT